MRKTKKNKVISLVKKMFFKLIPLIIVGVICFFVGRQIGLNTDTTSSNTTVEDVRVETRTISKTISASGQIKEYVTKKLSLDKYTNGKYLIAPYDLVITSKSIPSKNGKVKNNHYLKVSSVNALKVQIKVDESKMSSISLGQSAIVKIGALNDKKYEGIITNISSTASNGKFTITIEFDNDGEVLIGMTSEITIEKDA